MAASLPVFHLNSSLSSGPSSPRLRRPRAGAFSPPHTSPAGPIPGRLRGGGGGGSQLGRCWLRETRRGEALMTRAGPPSTNTLVFAFVFPLSMIIGTIFASIRIADQLDERYLEELARNGAAMLEKGDEGQNEEEKPLEEEAPRLKDDRLVPAASSSAPRSRNRPKRKV